MIFQQKTFKDGLDLLSADTQIQDGSYRWLVNARQRLGQVEANKKAIEITNAPAGKKQGGIAVGDVSIIFVAGSAYWRREGTTSWIRISGFAMDSIIDLYYTIAIPASTFNFVRKVDTSFNSPMLISADFNVSGTPAGVLVQDGSHQPWIIIFDEGSQSFIARETKKYTDWQNVSSTANDREYVPIGKQMMFLEQILFIVSTDGKQVYRSVSGRPLDFMVNVTREGHKLPAEAQGGASSVSFAFDNDIITNITPTNVADTFIYATARNVRLIALDFQNTIFDEPTFREAMPAMSAGIVNHQSVQEILGDYIFVDFEGMKSFNAVQQLKFEGRNSNFSLQLSKIFERNGTTIRQKDPVSFGFNNYSLFDVDTVWGRMICVYDNLINKWVGFDIISFTGRIKQFWATETVTETKLYVITSKNKVFQLYADNDNREVGMLHVRAVENEETKQQQKTQYLHVMFRKGMIAGKMMVFDVVDDQLSGYEERDLTTGLSGIKYPVRFPWFWGEKKQTENLSFPFPDGLQGRKTSKIIKWNTDAKLLEVEVITSDIGPDVSAPQSNLTAQSTYGG